MQLLADFFPLILFFVAFKWQGIYVATGVAIVASIVQIAVPHAGSAAAWLRSTGSRSRSSWSSAARRCLLQDETFIKWKPTVLYGLFGAILAGGRLLFGRNLLAHLMKGISLPEPVWTRLTWAWVAILRVHGRRQLVCRLPLSRPTPG